MLPSLKSLNVQIIDDPDGLCAVIALLAGLPTKNNLQTLAITFPADSAIPQERAFRDFDARVAALKTISSLKSIEITLPLEMDSTESIIRSYLTRLASKAPLSTFLE